MSTLLLDESDAIRMIQRLLDLRTHWILVGASPDSFAMIQYIEEEFYSDGSLSVMVINMRGLLMCIAWGSKDKMTTADVERIFEAEVGTRDILSTSDIPRYAIQWMENNLHSDNNLN